MEESNVYDRYLSPLDVLAISIGCTVGWGAFVMPGDIFLPMAGPLGTLIGLVLCIALVLVIGANLSFLMDHRPGTGGVYAYTKEAFGRDHAFLCAWFLSLSYLTFLFMNATSLFTVIRILFGRSLQIGFSAFQIAGNVIFVGEVAASFIALAGIGLLFINAKPFLQQLQTVLAIVLLAGVLLIAAISLPQIDLRDGFAAGSGSRAFGIYSIAMLAPGILGGFEVISLETAHFDFEVRRSRWIVGGAILLSGLLFLALTVVGIRAVPAGFASLSEYIAALGTLDGIAAVPTFYSASGLMGDAGLFIMSAAALAAILTGIIAAFRASARILSTMAEDRILSDRFSTTNSGILFIMVISILISFFGSNAMQIFMELTSLGAVICFGYVSASAWKLARRSGTRRVMVTGILGTVAAVAFAVVKLIPGLTALDTMHAGTFLVLSLWCLLGFMFYLRTVARSSAGTNNGTSTSSVMMFALLLLSLLMWLGKRLMAAGSVDEVRRILGFEGVLMLVSIFIGLGIMLYIQRLMQKKHEASLRQRTTDE